MKCKTKMSAMLVLSAAMLAASGVVLSSSDSDSDDKGGGWFGGKGEKPGAAPVENPKYLTECGGCHFPYQPDFLPARSWEKLMATLDNHFGENAELPAEDAKALTEYLVANAGDKSSQKRSKKIIASIPAGETPLRISETAYFVKEHREVPRKMVQDNPEVGSFSKCNACHTQADKGSYSEKEINIPGFGPFED